MNLHLYYLRFINAIFVTNKEDNEMDELKPSFNVNKKKKNIFAMDSASLLDAQLPYVAPGMLIVYIVLQVLIGLDHAYSEKPICNEDVHLDDYVSTINSGAAACLILNCTLQVIRICSYLTVKGKINWALVNANTSLLMLSSISGSSMILTFAWDYGGMCKDVFGVYSVAAQWAEWFVTVPFLTYISCGVEHKSKLDRFDWIMVGGLFIIIICGFLLNVVNFAAGVFFLTLAFIVLALLSFLTIVNYYKQKKRSLSINLRSTNFFKEKQTIRKAFLLGRVALILPYYPGIYLLALSGVFDKNLAVAGIMAGSMFGKLLFSSLVVESHVNMLYEYLLKTSSRGGSIQLGDTDTVAENKRVANRSSTDSFEQGLKGLSVTGKSHLSNLSNEQDKDANLSVVEEGSTISKKEGDSAV